MRDHIRTALTLAAVLTLASLGVGWALGWL